MNRQVSPDAGNVRLNASGNPVKSVAETLACIERLLAAIPKRVDFDEVDLPDVARMAGLHAKVEASLAATIRGLRKQRDWRDKPTTSWGDVGRALGITRQTAQERFGARRP